MTTQKIEKRIIAQVAKSLIRAGFTIRVFDGGEVVTEKTTHLKTIMGEVFATESTSFRAYRGEHYAGVVCFVHGNGCDVIHDNSVSLEPFLKEASDLADTL
jgi:hypothetical protein